jgi:Cu(I)/Ag(I) efflux system membrane fusion protein
MKLHPIKAAATLILLALVGATWWWLRPLTKTTAGSSAAIATPTAKRAVLYWHDPMVPGQRFDKPGKSPFMDMQLVPVYADDDGHAGTVKVTANVVQSLGIRLGKVEDAVLQSRFTAVGGVAFDERRIELLQARVNGYISRLHVKSPLERVRRGDILAEITSPDWLQAEHEYLALLGDDSELTATLKSAARRRLLVLGIPAATVADIETQRVVPGTTAIRAPLDGVVTELGVREGSSFMAGALLFRINGLATVWVNAAVPESQLHLIPMHSTVTAQATGWPGEEFTGRVDALLPEVDPTTRTLTLRAVLDNAARKLSPGMFVTLTLASAATKPRRVVPSEAVIVTGRRHVLILAHADGSFDAVDVTTGVEADGKTEILSGIAVGQAIVLSGQFLIDSEASLKATLDRLTSEPRP